jgi:hypothetical protein
MPVPSIVGQQQHPPAAGKRQLVQVPNFVEMPHRFPMCHAPFLSNKPRNVNQPAGHWQSQRHTRSAFLVRRHPADRTNLFHFVGSIVSPLERAGFHFTKPHFVPCTRKSPIIVLSRKPRPEYFVLFILAPPEKHIFIYYLS